jgi:hypothetical protein
MKKGDMIPVGVADEQVHRQRPALELVLQRQPELPDSGTGVEDQNVAASADLHAGRVPAIGRGGRTGGRDRAAGPPEFHAELGSGSGSGLALSLHGGQEMPGIDRLHEVLVRAQLPGPDDIGLVGLGRHDDDDGPRAPGLPTDLLQHLKAVHPVHEQVAHDHIGLVEARERHPVRTVGGAVDGESLTLEQQRQQFHRVGVVLDDEDRPFHVAAPPEKCREA